MTVRENEHADGVQKSPRQSKGILDELAIHDDVGCKQGDTVLAIDRCDAVPVERRTRSRLGNRQRPASVCQGSAQLLRCGLVRGSGTSSRGARVKGSSGTPEESASVSATHRMADDAQHHLLNLLLVKEELSLMQTKAVLPCLLQAFNGEFNVGTHVIRLHGDGLVFDGELRKAEGYVRFNFKYHAGKTAACPSSQNSRAPSLHSPSNGIRPSAAGSR